jgi:hypothetical protein
MNKERLLNVAKALRESPNPDDFTMKWVRNECGTPACALGHYAAREDLQSEFRLLELDRLASPGVAIRSLQTGDLVAWCDPDVLNHFGIDREQNSLLFSSDGCDVAQTAAEAAEYIERFVSEH